jgi:hypothetical protein
VSASFVTLLTEKRGKVVSSTRVLADWLPPAIEPEALADPDEPDGLEAPDDPAAELGEDDGLDELIERVVSNVPVMLT